MGGRGMRRHWYGAWLHARARLRTLATGVDGLIVLVVAGIAALVLWPGLTGPGGSGWGRLLPSGPEHELRAFDLAIAFLWLLLWPVVPVVAAAGRSTGVTRGDAFAQRACPALPVGGRTRLAVEAALVPFAAVGTRLAADLLGLPLQAGSLRDMVCGALVTVPVVVAWAAPARTVPLLGLRPVVVIAVLFLAGELGMLATPARLTGLSLALIAFLLATVGVETSSPRLLSARRNRAGALSRTALPPDRQLRRDFLLEPLRRLGPLATALIGFVVVLTLVERLLALPPFTVYIASIAAFSQVFAMALVEWLFAQSR